MASPLSSETTSQADISAPEFTAQDKDAEAISKWEAVVDETVKAHGPTHEKTLQATVRLHHAALRAYLGGSALQERLSSKSRETLLRLSLAQLHELSTDVFDDLRRRQAAGSLPRPEGPSASEHVQDEAPAFLPARPEFHEKRNEARQKLASLQPLRFRDLCKGVYSEMEKRIPQFDLDGNGEGDGVTSASTAPTTEHDGQEKQNVTKATAVSDDSPPREESVLVNEVLNDKISADTLDSALEDEWVIVEAEK